MPSPLLRSLGVAAALGLAATLVACPPAETPEQRLARLRVEVAADPSSERLGAVQAAAALGMEGAPVLELALRDDDAAVRQAAVTAFTGLGPGALEALRKGVVETPGDDSLKIDEAAGTLSYLATPEAVRVLFELWRRDDVSDGNKASPALGLGSRGGEALVPLLIEGLSDPSVHVQACCAMALGDTKTPSPEARAALRKLVEATGGKGYAGGWAELALRSLEAAPTQPAEQGAGEGAD